MITHTTDKCKYCLSVDTLITNFSSGEIVCTNCGVVLEERIIDEENEIRNFFDDDGKSRSRLGGPINYAYEDKLGSGLVLSKGSDNFLRFRNQKESPIKKIFKRAEELCYKLSIPIIILECSKDIFHSLVKASKFRKAYIDHIILVVFYKELMKQNIKRSINEWKKTLGLESSDIKKAFALIEGYLPDEKKHNEQLSSNMIFLCSKLDIRDEDLKIKLRNTALDIAERFIDYGILEGTDTGTIAAAVLLLTAKLLQIDNITFMSIKTISSIRFKQLKTVFLIMIQQKQLIPMEYKAYLDNLNERVINDFIK